LQSYASEGERSRKRACAAGVRARRRSACGAISCLLPKSYDSCERVPWFREDRTARQRTTARRGGSKGRPIDESASLPRASAGPRSMKITWSCCGRISCSKRP